MDYEKVKELVVSSCWKGRKFGDTYRSLRIQLDHFVEHIEQENSPLKWLPLDDMSEEELAEIARKFLKRSDENRLLFEGLKYQGIKYNYNELLVKNPEREEERKKILEADEEADKEGDEDVEKEITEEVFKLKDYEKLKIIELLEDVNTDLTCAYANGYKQTADKFLYYNDVIRNEILDEKSLFEWMGLDLENTDYIEQYITVCDRICLGTLYFFIIENANVECKRNELQKIKEKLERAGDLIVERLKKAKNTYKQSRKIYEEQYACQKNRADEITRYYVQFLNRKAYYEELEKIMELLRSEPNSQMRQEVLTLPEDENELLEYISEGERIPNFDVKLEQCKQMISLAKENGNLWGSSKDAQVLKIALREWFVRKTKYRRRTAVSIVRNIVTGQTPCEQELLFLDMKIIHGVFRERNLLEEFELFSQICSKVRKMYLLAYSAINDEEAYRIVHRVCFEFLYLFGDTEYSGLKLE